LRGGVVVVCMDGIDHLFRPLPPLDTWVHLAFEKKGSTITFYFDGVAQGNPIDHRKSINDSDGELRIGMEGSTWGKSFFLGKIDDVRFYNRALTADEILMAMNTLEPEPTLEPQAQVILAWHEAWNNKDIDAFMDLVADDAVLDRGPYGVITGKEKIRAIVILEMEENLKAKVSRFEVQGNKVTYYYEVFIGARRVDQGVGVAIVENGKIKSDLPAK